MNLIDWIIIFIIAAAAVPAVRHLWKTRHDPCGSCSMAGSCSGGCSRTGVKTGGGNIRRSSENSS